MNAGKEKAKFGIIDAVIILLILAIVALVGYLILSQNGAVAGKDTCTVLYTVKITTVADEYLDCLEKGSTVFDSSDGKSKLGVITDVKTEKAKVCGTEPDENGTLPVYTYEDVSDVYVTIRSADCTVDDNGFCNVNGTRILVGSEIYFSSNYFNRIAYCTSYNVIG